MNPTPGPHVRDLLARYVDDELDEVGRRRVEQHCAGCRDCARELAELQDLWHTVETGESPPPATPLWPGIAARLRDAASGSGPGGGVRARIFDLGWGLTGSALAAGLVLGLLVGGGGPGAGDPAAQVSDDLLGGDESVVLGTGDATLGGLWLAASVVAEEGS
jgi:anti-sigma factor RsiW